MTVKELINILNDCDPDIQVVVSQKGMEDSCSVLYGIKSVEQGKNYSPYNNDDEWPYMVKIRIGRWQR